MDEEFSISDILSRESGLSELLGAGQHVGLTFTSRKSTKHVIDFGSVEFDMLEILDPEPSGYEDCSSDQHRKRLLTLDVHLKLNKIRNMPSAYTLMAYEVLPFPNPDLYQMELILPDGDDATGCEILPDFPQELGLRKLIISPTCVSICKCAVGVLVRGSVVDSGTVAFSKQLSIDAKPFMPQIAVSYFDNKCVLFECGSITSSIPPNYRVPLRIAKQLAMDIATNIDSSLPDKYMTAVKTKSFREFVLIAACEALPFDVFPDLSMRQPHQFNACNMPIPLPVNWQAYICNLGLLTYLEELQMDIDICQYDIRFKKMFFEYSYLTQDLSTTFVVNGSCENRPRIMIGDIVRIRPTLESLQQGKYDAISKQIKYFELFEMVGVVTGFDLRTEKVTCRFGKPEGKHALVLRLLNEHFKFHIRFSFDKFGFHFMHQAILAACHTQTVPLRLFPSENYVFQPQILPLLPTPGVLNRQQQEAVVAIASLCYGPGRTEHSLLDYPPSPVPPYIIYGPPGTGKTCTIIEAIVETLKRNPNARILACAPSDAAADVMCKRLIGKGFFPDELFRLNWWQRTVASVHPSLHKYCCLKSNGTTFDIPPFVSMVRFKIVVSTSVAAGVIQHIKAPASHRGLDAGGCIKFDLVVIDEVSQATEAEALVPIMCVKDSGIVVLAGDPEQLGPCPRTPVYHMSGMTQSLQQRLLRCKIYSTIQPRIEIKKDESRLGYLFDKLGVYLVHNYRSQKSILHVPSELFYGGVLMESGDKESLDSLGSWEKLKGIRFADESGREPDPDPENVHTRPFVVLFEAVDGVHKHDVDSPSFYNIDEIKAVVKLCASLVHTHGERLGVTSRDIGVIGAFRSQVLKLRIALRNGGLGGINVGSVEDYQGQETRIVIISTVLSQRVPTMEVNGALGLIGDHRKFNVAVTRGMQLVIVVGHPYCLHTDPNWRHYLNFCDKHGGYTGFPCSLLDSAQTKKSAEDMLSRLLGGGIDNGESIGGLSMMGGLSMYYSDNLEWRGML